MPMRDEGENMEKAEGRNPKASDLLTFLPSYLLFFLLCFLYLWLVVEPNLIYYCFGTILPDAPPFATGWSFFGGSLDRPGGPVTYVSGFLSQGFYHPWLGAIVIVLVGFCLSELTRRHLAAAGFALASVAATVPAILFFLIYSHYKHPLTIGLVVSLGLLLSLAVEKLFLRRPLLRVVTYSLAAAIGFWLGGGGTLLLFALMTVVHTLRRVCRARLPGGSDSPETVRSEHWLTWVAAASASLPMARQMRNAIGKLRRLRLPLPPNRKPPAILGWLQCDELLALPVGVVMAWVLARYVFLIPSGQALLSLTPFAPATTAGLNTLLKVLVFLLYGFVPGMVLLVLVGTIVFAGRAKKAAGPSKKARGKDKHAVTHRWWRSLAALKKPALAAVPVVLMAMGLYFSYDELRKPYVLSNCYCRQKRWDKIVELSRRLPKGKSNVYVSHDILRALYHTGRLPYDMFRHALIPEAILLTHEDRQSDLTQWKLSDIFLELGHVNMAQKLASEVVTTKGHLGVALEELGWIGIIKGQPGTARVYLNALKKDLVYRGRAESLLDNLDRGFTSEQTAYIDRIRSYMWGEGIAATGTEPVDETLAALLKHNPRNKMAFEYLMACYLLTGRVDKIAENVERLRDLGYPKIPTLYEEAILIHYGSTGKQVDLAKLDISRDTLQRYEAFVRLAGAMETQDRQAVLNRLIRDFGATYFFYFTFGRVGLA